MAHSLDEKLRTEDVIINDNVSFNSLFLSQNIFNALERNGYRKPSPIQLKAIPVGRCGFDLVVKSKSGTGKTLVFSIIALEILDVKKKEVQALILVPTREIAVQIKDVLKVIGQFIEGLSVESFIGGTPIETDKENCKKCHIAVGAPGRIKHLVKDGHLKTDKVKLFVLDEADKLMESSFENDINEIYNSLPDRKQMITTSATYPDELDVFLSEYMLSPTHISVELESPLLLGLKQYVKILKPCHTTVQQVKIKNEQLITLLSNVSFTQCLVFSNFQTRAESISNFLNSKGWESNFISAAQTQSKRLEAIGNLKEFKCRILLSTDLTARGIDAANVDLVINYDVPVDAMTYLHRMGRAGRYGSSGLCISMAFENKELPELKGILGTIGGTSLSMPILPELNENESINLLTLDANKVEQIYGVINETNTKVIDFKNEVIDLKLTKNKKCQNKKQKQKNSPKKISDEENEETSTQSILASLSTGNIDDVKNKCNNLKNEDYLNVSSIDTNSILASLASGNLDLAKNQIESKKDKTDISSNGIKNILDLTKREEESFSQKLSEINTTALLKSLASEKKNDETNENDTAKILEQLALGSYYKKRKRPEDSAISPNANPKEKCKPLDNVFSKNKAILSVSKMLYDQKSKAEEDDLDSIQKYLTTLKQEDVENTRLELENVEVSTDQTAKRNNDCEKTESMENIFKIGYDYATKKSAKHWLDCIPESEIRSSVDVVFDEEDEDYDEYTEENDEYEMEEDVDENTTSIYRYPHENNPDYDFMKWLPVGKTKIDKNTNKVAKTELFRRDDSEVAKTDFFRRDEASGSSYEHLRTYFDQCSNNLWENGLNFENVTDFDNWFYNDWQAQVNSVRDFIRQNIYVSEMSKFQQQQFESQ